VLFGEEGASRRSVARNNGDAHPPTIALSYVTILARMSDSECRSESAKESFLEEEPLESRDGRAVYDISTAGIPFPRVSRIADDVETRRGARGSFLESLRSSLRIPRPKAQTLRSFLMAFDRVEQTRMIRRSILRARA